MDYLSAEYVICFMVCDCDIVLLLSDQCIAGTYMGQKIQAESIAELDKKTNEMLLKNAQNTVDVSKMTAKMASGSSIQIETLEKTWATITNGIEETRRIQEDARKKRQEDQVRLEAIKQDFNKQYNVPPVRK